MAHISYSKKTWTDTASSGNTLNAASLNNIESGIKNSVDKINSIDDKISTVDKIFCGSVVCDVDPNGYITVFTNDMFSSYFGRSFNPHTDCVAVFNGDWQHCSFYTGCAAYLRSPADKIQAKILDEMWDAAESQIRINFIVALGTVNYEAI